MTTNLLADRESRPVVLDPRLLGRPIHLLSSFASRLREDLTLALRSSHNRRYWSTFEIGDVSLAQREPQVAQERWIGYTDHGAQLGFAIERQAVLKILDQRYGRRDEPATIPTRITATEDRLTIRLGQQLVQVLLARLLGGMQPASTGLAQAATPALTSAPMPAPAKGCWIIRIVLIETHSAEQAVAWLSLDEYWFDKLLKGLAPLTGKVTTPVPPPLTTRLQVSVRGRLVSKEVSLEKLLGLRVGDVLPVHIGRTEVLLDEACLFTAAIVEHNGKLCLTSFQDTE